MSTDRPPGPDPDQPPPYPWQHPTPEQQPASYPDQPAPYAGYGSPAGQQPAYPDWPGSQAPAYPGGTGQWPSEPALRRPGSVTAGVVLSWIGGLVFVILGVLAMLLANNPAFLTEIERTLDQEIDDESVTAVLRGLGALILVWGVGVLFAATFAWQRRKWARIMLTVMGVLYILVQLLAVLSGAVAALFSVLWTAFAVVLLWIPTSSAWFAGRGGSAQRHSVRPPQPW